MNRVVTILVIGSLISLIYNPTFSFAQGNWKQLPATPTARTENSAVLLKGKIYILGGFTPQGVTTRVDVWNPISKNWNLAEPLPRALHHTTARVVNEKIYVIGGFESGSWTPVNATYEYVPELNKWFNKTPMPTARGAHAAAIINGKIHLVGGAHRKLFKLVNTNAHEAYNPAKDSWKKLPPLPTPRDHLTTTVKNGRLFAIGGRINVNYQNNLNSNESYNPKTGKWNQLAPLPTARSGVTSQLLNGWIHVLGGESSEGTFVENEGYNPEKNKWKTFPPLPIGLHGLASVIFMDKIHLLNGGRHPGGSGSKHHLTFSK